MNSKKDLAAKLFAKGVGKVSKQSQKPTLNGGGGGRESRKPSPQGEIRH